MKNYLSCLQKYAPSVVLAVLLIAALVQLADVKNELNQLRGNVNSQMNSMSYDIRSISYGIDRQLRAANSLIVDDRYELTGVDIAARTATLSCSLTPKKYQPGVTTWAVVQDGKSVDMREENGVYTAELTVPLFEVTEIQSAQMEENGVISTEPLDWYVMPRDEYIPYVTVRHNGSRTGPGWNTKGEMTSPVTYNWELVIHIDSKKSDAGIEKIELVETTNGNEQRTDIPLNVQRTSKVAGQAYAVPEDGIDGATTFYHDLRKSVTVASGDSYEMAVEVTDSLGLRHRTVLHQFVAGEKEEDIFSYEADIYDADGNLLYKGY